MESCQPAPKLGCGVKALPIRAATIVVQLIPDVVKHAVTLTSASVMVHAACSARFDGSNFLGGFTYQLTDTTSFTYNTTVGNFGNIGAGYAHSIVVTEQLTDKIELVAQSDLTEIDDNESVSFNYYVFYKFNDCVKEGLRWEWWKNNGNSLTAVTYGWNFRPHANVVIRPEYKYIMSKHDDATVGFPVNTGLFSIDAIVTY